MEFSTLSALYGGSVVLSRGYGGDTYGLLIQEWPTHFILIRGKRTGHGHSRLKFASESSQRISTLQLEFEDTTQASEVGAPTTTDIERLIEFAASASRDAKLLIACPGGYGRSTAAAIIARVALGDAPHGAIEVVTKSQPRATPNRLMLAIADGILDQNGRLWSCYREWAQMTHGVAFPAPVRVRSRRRRRARGS